MIKFCFIINIKLCWQLFTLIIIIIVIIIIIII